MSSIVVKTPMQYLDQAANASMKWRERATAETARSADAMLADIRLARGDAAAALKVLAPYEKQLTSEPNANVPMTASLLRAWVRTGRAAPRRARRPALRGPRTGS